ncbi:hypothetical protein Slin15195_G078830 [Septoria linicola]|uniref:Uncharacterized protein n=1 Tax=Septoria linicola TaxID=215465 RepID=A0A9Q9ATQ6_9PEZI|nr:hypothetical protein Slin14017_G040030 [Septoria linicola]USW54564.1 hypothetical protein Slin15195_G078830 [Septoria linicola]
MASSLQTLQTFFGLNSSATQPSLTATYITFHFIFAYAGISTRPWKAHYKLDHQVSPRQDLTKYGPKGIQSQNISLN